MRKGKKRFFGGKYKRRAASKDATQPSTSATHKSPEGETAMLADGLDGARLADENFNAPEYISSFLKQVKQGDELRNLQAFRKLLTSRSNTAAETIKDIVFEHYKYFIETSKEISNLEREIYQLSGLLSEQKLLIENLMVMNGQEKKSTSSALAFNASSSSQNQLHSLMHKMDGVAAIINTMRDNERILLQSQMTLLDATTMESEHPVLLVLLSNSLLVGHPTSAEGKYAFQLVANHSLDDIAVVNFKAARDDGAAPADEQHVLQLLVFPAQIYVRCENARQKREWLDTVEQVKRRHEQEKSLVRQATIRARRRSTLLTPNDQQLSSQPATSKLRESGRRARRPATTDKAAPTTASRSTAPLSAADAQWLNELIDELQVIISDRHMDQAVELLLEWKDCGCRDDAINAKFTAIERQVVKILSDDIRRPGSRHGGGGRVAFSKPMVLLGALGRQIYAVDLYLRRRGAFLRSCTSELISEEPLSYVRQICTLFVNEVLDVAGEFADRRQLFCLILQWASGELSVLLAMIRKNVVEVTPTISVLAHTWRILIANCDQLASVGMDLSFEINRLLTPTLTHALQVNFNNVIESIMPRISEERWKPYNLESESNLNRFLEEMSDFGLPIDWAICEGGGERFAAAINISYSACQFARLAFSLSRDFALLEGARLSRLTDSFLQMLWCEYLLQLATASPSSVQEATARFIVGQVIPLCDATYQTVYVPDGRFASNILNEKFPSLAKFTRTTSFDEEIATV